MPYRNVSQELLQAVQSLGQQKNQYEAMMPVLTWSMQRRTSLNTCEIAAPGLAGLVQPRLNQCVQKVSVRSNMPSSYFRCTTEHTKTCDDTCLRPYHPKGRRPCVAITLLSLPGPPVPSPPLLFSRYHFPSSRFPSLSVLSFLPRMLFGENLTNGSLSRMW